MLHPATSPPKPRTMMAAAYSAQTLTATPDVLRLATPASHASHSSRNPHNLVMDPFDHDLAFDADRLLDDVSNGIPNLQFTPSYELDTFSTTFEDPFSYQSGPFESLLDDAHNTNSTDAAPQDLDNKLLSFGPPNIKAPVLDDTGQTWPAMSAELYGMFFVAEDVFGGETTGRPMELTCYRRNLFQISGTVTLSRTIAHMVNEQAQQVPIYDLTASISAFESIEGKPTEIISVPWKTANATSSEDKAGAAPPKWPLDLSMNPELDPACVSIPIAWKRLQFKHATANNGRRKGLQQHYVIQINLMASLATGETVKLAEILSGPIIVRGRSPRNFDSRKDVPLNERKLEPKSRTSSDSNLPPIRIDPSAAAGSRFYSFNPIQPFDLPEWSGSSPIVPETPRLSKKPSLSSSRPPVPKTHWKMETPTKLSRSGTAPIDLSIADEEYTRAQSTLSNGSKSGGEPISPQNNKKAISSPVESAETLYEYFPLSVDDWMPPVDAIYRPHVVHHTIVPEEVKAQQVKKTKRYFSADD